MRKLKLYIATSLNGYIAKSNHSEEWLDKIPAPEGEDYGFVAFYNSCVITLMGNNTYQFIFNSGHDFPYTTTDNYVITRDKNLESNADVTFIRENHVEFVKNLKSVDNVSGIIPQASGSIINTEHLQPLPSGTPKVLSLNYLW